MSGFIHKVTYLGIPVVHLAKKRFCTIYQKSGGHFFDKGSIDDKSEVRFEKHSLVDVRKLKMVAVAEFTFLISALPTGDAFQFRLQFYHL